MTSPTSVVAPRTRPIRFYLDLLLPVCGLMCFAMAQDGISAAAGWAFLLGLAVVGAASFLDLPRPPGFVTFAAVLLLLIPILGQISLRYAAEPLLEALLLLFLLRVYERRGPREYAQVVIILLAAAVIYAVLSVERVFMTVCVGVGIVGSMILMMSAWMRREPDARLSWSDVRGLLARALGMFLVMLPLCLLLFFAAPRFRSPFRVSQGGFGATTGFSDQLSLGDVGQIQESGRLAFRAEMRDIAPRTPYWRGVVLSLFTGDTWTVNLVGRRGGWDAPTSGAENLRYSIQMEPSGHRWLFTLDRPVTLWGTDALDLGNGTYAHRSFNGARYEAESVLDPTGGGSLTPRDEALCLQLPEGYSPAVRRLAEEIAGGAKGDREKMEAVVARLSGGEYRWTLRNLAQGRNALEDFLLRLKRGNCEYFASAAGVMLRMLGVPARLVGGYRGGDYNRTGGFYSVRDLNAHVWVEAWDRASRAWIRLDPTPTALEDEVEAEVLASGSGWGEFWDYLDYQWNRYFVAYGGSQQAQWAGALRSLLRNPRAALPSVGSFMDGTGRGASRAAFAVGAVILALASGWGVWRYAHRDERAALLRRFDRLMARRGFVRSPCVGLLEFAWTLPEPLRADALDFASGLSAVFYGGRELDGPCREALLRALSALSSTRG